MGMLEYKGYYGSIEFSEVDNFLFGKVLNMYSTLITYEGNTAEELYDDFKEGIKRYLDFCKNNGIEPDKNDNISIDICIPAELYAKVALYAQNHNISIENFILDAIERRLEVVN
jgi:predicted HicB family RNase H-like nuclease